MSTDPKADTAPPPNPVVDAVKAMAAIIALPAVAAMAFTEPTMGVGAPIPQVTGPTGLEVVGRTGSPFMQDFMAATFVAGAFTLVQALSTPPATPEQQQVALAQEEQRKAGLAEDEARREQSIARETERQAYFANKGPG